MATAARGPLMRSGGFAITLPCASYATTLSGTISPAFIVRLVGSATRRETGGGVGAAGCCAPRAREIRALAATTGIVTRRERRVTFIGDSCRRSVGDTYRETSRLSECRVVPADSSHDGPPPTSTQA